MIFYATKELKQNRIPQQRQHTSPVTILRGIYLVCMICSIPSFSCLLLSAMAEAVFLMQIMPSVPPIVVPCCVTLCDVAWHGVLYMSASNLMFNPVAFYRITLQMTVHALLLRLTVANLSVIGSMRWIALGTVSYNLYYFVARWQPIFQHISLLVSCHSALFISHLYRQVHPLYRYPPWLKKQKDTSN